MNSSFYNMECMLRNNLTRDEYNIARNELESAIYWCKQDNIPRAQDWLLRAMKILDRHGQSHAVKIVSDCAKFL